MPSKRSNSKIIAVPVDSTTLDFEDNEQSKTEAQDMNTIIEELKSENQPTIPEEPNQVETKAPEKKITKPRAKPKPKAKPVEAPVETFPVEAPLEVAIVEEAKPKKAKAELVECPDCQKKLTAKTLKYNHSHNCPANKFKEQVKPEQQSVAPMQEQVQVQPVNNQTAREVRTMKREKLIHSLISQAF